MRKLFTSQKLKILASGRVFEVQALVSLHGAKYIFEELPETLKEHGKKELGLLYKGIRVRASLVRESTEAGAVYHLRFLSPGEALLQQIQADILDSGLPSPWRRSLPRLNAQVKNLPVPSIAVAYHGGQNHFLTVRNFTLGGILLEHVGQELESIVVGSKLEFDLVTNYGDKIADLSGVVAHITEENDGALRLQLGLKFLPMSLLSDAKYRKLIREHVLSLQTLLKNAA